MVIRPLVCQDKEKILRVLRQRGTFTEKEIKVAVEVVDDALHYPEREDYHIFCAYDEAENFVGYICFGPIPMTQNCYDLYWIVVDEQFSRKGIGGRLLRFMEDRVVRENARRIYLDTSSTQAYLPARSFYEKHGYRLVCILRDFYREGDHKMIFMKELRGVESSAA
jgi:ribosomal protein S18 acetylase RimI-like enzyme